MSLDAIIGKPVQYPETVVAKPAPEVAERDDDLEQMLMAIKRRSRRLAFSNALGGSRIITEQSVRQGD